MKTEDFKTLDELKTYIECVIRLSILETYGIDYNPKLLVSKLPQYDFTFPCFELAKLINSNI